jgi:hypothetical protein
MPTALDFVRHESCNESRSSLASRSEVSDEGRDSRSEVGSKHGKQEQATTVALEQADAENRYRLRAARSQAEAGLALLDKLDRSLRLGETAAIGAWSQSGDPAKCSRESACLAVSDSKANVGRRCTGPC